MFSLFLSLLFYLSKWLFLFVSGEFKRVPEPKDHDDDKKSSAVITAATVGSIIAVIAGLFSVFVAIIVRRRCGKCCNSSHAPPPSAPPHACPSPYTSFPSNMPPSYNECLDTGKYHPSSSGLSQILATSTKGDTEKSCWFYFQSHWWTNKQRNGHKTQTVHEWFFKYHNHIFRGKIAW